MLDAAIAGTAELSVAEEALDGLLARPKTLPPKLFYDAAGVRLFEAITRLPEYYLTRTEMALLRRIAPELAALAPAGAALVEYGASDAAKARILLEAAGAVFAAFVPVDVAGPALAAMKTKLATELPALPVYPVQADFMRPVVLPDGVALMPKFGFFPGSTIGNFDPAAAVAFLRDARTALGADSWLILGADLRKAPETLIPAYDDAAGVTAAFNLNLLHRLNREAGADFDPARFRHRAVWNDAASRIEMHLVSEVAQTVHVAGAAITLRAGETIHTENSYKHSEAALRALAARAGWAVPRLWTDNAGLFAVLALRAKA
jgi:dimethylhistidine N-methyltransferase